MWNQWPSVTGVAPLPPTTLPPQPAPPPLPAAPPPPPPSNPSPSVNEPAAAAPIIGPMLPTMPQAQSQPQPSFGIGVMATPSFQQPAITDYSNPYSQYTTAQYAAMTPEQQYALQQHWQQWQAYQTEYAKWHAQYGEQYKREMEAAAARQTTAQPPVQTFTQVDPMMQFSAAHTAFFQQPPPPPPTTKQMTIPQASGKIACAPQMYTMPPQPQPQPQPQQPPIIPQQYQQHQQPYFSIDLSKPPPNFHQPTPITTPMPNFQQPPTFDRLPNVSRQPPNFSQPPNFNQPPQIMQNQSNQNPIQRPPPTSTKPPIPEEPKDPKRNELSPIKENSENPEAPHVDLPSDQNVSQSAFSGETFQEPESDNEEKGWNKNNNLNRDHGRSVNDGDVNMLAANGPQDCAQNIENYKRNESLNRNNRSDNNFDNRRPNNFAPRFGPQPNQSVGRPNNFRNNFNADGNNDNFNRVHPNGPTPSNFNDKNGTYNRNSLDNKYGYNAPNSEHFSNFSNQRQQSDRWSNNQQENYGSGNQNSQGRFRWGGSKQNEDNYDFYNQHGEENAKFGMGRNQRNWGPGDPNRQQQQPQPQQRAPPELDEESFDRQFHQWEKQFEDWKRANANHPDREMYNRYEQEFEKQRKRIVERREQMRKRKLEQRGIHFNPLTSNNNPVSPFDQGKNDAPSSTESEKMPEQKVASSDETSSSSLSKKVDCDTTMDRSSLLGKRKSPFIAEKEQPQEQRISKPTAVEPETTTLGDDSKSGDSADDSPAIVSSSTEPINNIFQKTEGIPGLDLVEEESEVKDTEQGPDNEIIDLDAEYGPTLPSKVAAKSSATNRNMSSIKPDEKEKLPDQSILAVQVKAVASADISNALKDPDFMEKIKSALQQAQGKASSDEVTENANLSAEAEDKMQEDDNDKPLSFAEWQRKKMCNQKNADTPNMQDASNRTDQIDRPEISNESDQTGSFSPNQNSNVPFGGGTGPFYCNSGNGGNGNGNSGNGNGSNSGPNFRGNNPDNIHGSDMSGNCNLRSYGPNNFRGNGPKFGGNGNGSNFSGKNLHFNESGPNMYGSAPNGRFQGSGPGPGFRGPNEPFFGGNRPKFGPDGASANYRGNDPNFGGCGPNFGGGSGPQFRGDRPHSHFGGPNFRNGPNAMNDMFPYGQRSNSSFNNEDMNAARGNNPFRQSGPSTPAFNDNSANMNFRCPEDGKFNIGNGSWLNSSGAVYRPVQVIDYQNNSGLAPKVIDYGHKATATMQSQQNFRPIKTIDYGHASGALNRRQGDACVDNSPTYEYMVNQKTKKNINQNINKEENRIQQGTNQPKPSQAEDPKPRLSKESEKPTPATSQSKPTEIKNTEAREDLEQISDTEDNLMGDEAESEYLGPPVPPPPPMLSSKPSVFIPAVQRGSDEPPASIFPSTASANENIAKTSIAVQMSIPTLENQNTITIDEILLKPGRLTRPKKICIILRGPPGSGKSHVAKLIKEKETEVGGANTRVLSIDDYFLIENDYDEKCPKTGKNVPKKEILYEYERTMEDTYMQCLIKSFKKTIADSLYDIIIVDCNNNSLRSLNEFYCHAKDSGFMPYIVDLFCDASTCLERNIHNRTEKDINEIIGSWKATPFHYIKIDVSSLLTTSATETENADSMVTVETESRAEALDDDEKTLKGEESSTASNDCNLEDDSCEAADSTGICGFLKSKWENDNTTESLARLDGTNKLLHRAKATTMEDYLQLDDWTAPAVSQSGKKRVRWADIEERRAQEKMRAIGFVVGQTDWERMMDPNAGNRALNKTKYIERVAKRH